jgi:hypothetical protein
LFSERRHRIAALAWNGARFVATVWKLTVPAMVHLHSVLSPDRKLWCTLDDSSAAHYAWCGYAGPPPPEHSGRVRPNGQVTLCTATSPGDCLQNWDDAAPILRYGQRDELYGYRCTSAKTGITCVVIASGKGFAIDRAGVTKVGP